MKRLTKQFMYGLGHKDCCDACSVCDVAGRCDLIEEMLEKLAYYEDLEEQGKLIELPCLPNEEVWESHKRFGTHKTMYASREAIVGAIEAGYAIGYTKEEAEAKLAKKQYKEFVKKLAKNGDVE